MIHQWNIDESSVKLGSVANKEIAEFRCSMDAFKARKYEFSNIRHSSFPIYYSTKFMVKKLTGKEKEIILVIHIPLHIKCRTFWEYTAILPV